MWPSCRGARCADSARASTGSSTSPCTAGGSRCGSAAARPATEGVPTSRRGQTGTMAETQDSRVAVYPDCDDSVMSSYDRGPGRQPYGRARQRSAAGPTGPEIAGRLERATVDVGAIIDCAASFGSLTLTRAYADWSSPVNAIYRSQLVARAVDLVQLFPAAAYA